MRVQRCAPARSHGGVPPCCLGFRLWCKHRLTGIRRCCKNNRVHGQGGIIEGVARVGNPHAQGENFIPFRRWIEGRADHPWLDHSWITEAVAIGGCAAFKRSAEVWSLGRILDVPKAACQIFFIAVKSRRIPVATFVGCGRIETGFGAAVGYFRLEGGVVDAGEVIEATLGDEVGAFVELM